MSEVNAVADDTKLPATQSNGRSTQKSVKGAKTGVKGKLPHGNRKQSEETPAIGIHRSFALAGLKSKSIFDVPGAAGDLVYSEDRVKEIKEMISDLYESLSAHKDFVDDGNWKKDTNPFDVLAWMYKKYEELVKPKHEWHVAYRSGAGYMFVEYFVYPIDHIGCKIETCWLPLLEKKNIKLFKMFMAFIGLWENTGAQLWDTQDHEWACEWTMEHINEQIEHYGSTKKEMQSQIDEIKSYQEGVAKKYLDRIRSMKWTAEKLDTNLKKYKPGCDHERAFTDWMIRGVEILKEGDDIREYCYSYNQPVEVDVWDILPLQSIGFEWDFRGQVMGAIEQYMNDQLNNGSTLLQMTASSCLVKEDIRMREYHSLKITDYPYKIDKFWTSFYPEVGNHVESYLNFRGGEEKEKAKIRA